MDRYAQDLQSVGNNRRHSLIGTGVAQQQAEEVGTDEQARFRLFRSWADQHIRPSIEAVRRVVLGGLGEITTEPHYDESGRHHIVYRLMWREGGTMSEGFTNGLTLRLGADHTLLCSGGNEESGETISLDVAGWGELLHQQITAVISAGLDRANQN